MRAVKVASRCILVSAWAARQRLVLGQEAIDHKSNEIAAIPLLLERLELTGALATIDAIGTQTTVTWWRSSTLPLCPKTSLSIGHQNICSGSIA